MPHATLKLIPGVDQNRTLAFNEAAISTTQLVRFIPDRQGTALIQKIGGWQKYYPNDIQSIVRALWAWEDTNGRTYLGLGTETPYFPTTSISGDGTHATITFDGTYTFSVDDKITIEGVEPAGYNGAYTVTSATSNSVTVESSVTGSQTVAGVIYPGDALSVIGAGVRESLTPLIYTSDATVNVDTTSGSDMVIIHDPGSKVKTFDVVQIKTQISVGGLILFGSYSCTSVDGDSFLINAVDILGNPQNATATVTGGGAVPVFNTTEKATYIFVDLVNHGFQVGDTFTVLTKTTVGGIDIYGNYTIVALDDTNPNDTFSIIGNNAATSTATAPMNAGLAEYTYYRFPGPFAATTGYGVGGYGDGGYGVGVPITGVVPGGYIHARDWTLDNWGQVLVACPVYNLAENSGGEIFIWDPTAVSDSSHIIPNAPTVNDGVFVAMPQRQLVAWGSTFTGIQDQLLIRWSDVGDYDTWTATVTNQAGSYRLPRGSKIISGIQGPQQGLIWTDLGIWAMQYTGPPYVYQFNEIGNGCGLIARKAAASMNGIVYWMSQSQFFRLAGEGVEIIPCPVWDVIFQDLDTSNLDRIRVAPNSRFGEISWFYPTLSSGGEVAKYVKYNTALNAWDFGDLARTAWINQSVLGPPIGAGLEGGEFIYQHETSKNADGAAMTSSFQTGYFVLSDGEWKIFVDQVWPDMKWGYYDGTQNANLQLTFYVTDYPGETVRTYGPYSLTSTTKFITPRFRGRLVSIKLESDDLDSFWRIGAMRYRYAPDGKF